MSQISAIYGTDDDSEIMNSLYLIANVSAPTGVFERRALTDCNARQNTLGLGLIHESISIYDSSDYTRSWFAWANSYFAEMLLDLAQRKPHLVLKDGTPYVPGQ